MTFPHNSCLDLIEETFQRLAADPDPMTVDGREICGGLPNRPIPVDELRITLLKRGCPTSTIDAAWSYLVSMAQAEWERWAPVAAGMMVPGLKRIGGRLGPCFPGDPGDLDSEVLAAYLEALRQTDPTATGVASHLYRAALHAAQRACRSERRAVDHRLRRDEDRYPRAGNPDLALARAVLDGVVTSRQANLVSGVLLDRHHRADIARRLGLSRRRARAQLASARRELAAYLAA